MTDLLFFREWVPHSNQMASSSSRDNTEEGNAHKGRDTFDKESVASRTVGVSDSNGAGQTSYWLPKQRGSL
jgi:hypothetical protein